MKRLKLDKNFIPCLVDDNDEMYPNGIFEFNITKMIEYIKNNPDNVPVEKVSVEDCWESLDLNGTYVDSVDISKPVILAEISPGRYNVIDGNHRVQKARKNGLKILPAYKLNPNQHINFLTTKKGYEAYIEFWNSKLKTYALILKTQGGTK